MKKLIILMMSIALVVFAISCSSTNVPNKCPACGSDTWSKVTEKNNGYNWGKGFVGRAFLGPVGWFAGSFGNSEDVYYCRECGFTCSY